MLKGEALAVEVIPPDELNSFISEFIITVRKKEHKEDFEPSSLRGIITSFEKYFKNTLIIHKKKEINV